MEFLSPGQVHKVEVSHPESESQKSYHKIKGENRSVVCRWRYSPSSRDGQATSVRGVHLAKVALGEHFYLVLS